MPWSRGLECRSQRSYCGSGVRCAQVWKVLAALAPGHHHSDGYRLPGWESSQCPLWSRLLGPMLWKLGNPMGSPPVEAAAAELAAVVRAVEALRGTGCRGPLQTRPLRITMVSILWFPPFFFVPSCHQLSPLSRPPQ